MSDLISRKEAKDAIYESFAPYQSAWVERIRQVWNAIDSVPTVEAVPKSYADQIRWERDIAVGQLNEIGCQFGQKMDEVKKVE